MIWIAFPLFALCLCLFEQIFWFACIQDHRSKFSAIHREHSPNQEHYMLSARARRIRLLRLVLSPVVGLVTFFFWVVCWWRSTVSDMVIQQTLKHSKLLWPVLNPVTSIGASKPMLLNHHVSSTIELNYYSQLRHELQQPFDIGAPTPRISSPGRIWSSSSFTLMYHNRTPHLGLLILLHSFAASGIDQSQPAGRGVAPH